ncbi:MAG: hypothetical protein AAGA54_21310 [Myxococcota bacterium]
MLALVLSSAVFAAAPTTSAEVAEVEAPRSGLRGYLTRDVAYSARYLDHGVLGVSGAGGWPHRYALRLHLGVLDHLTVGLQTHWVRGQSRPQFSPELAVAFVRLRWLEWGGYYRQTLYPPPEVDGDPTTPSFAQVDHWLLSSVSFSNKWLSGGFDFGLVRARIKDPGQDPPDDDTNPSTIRWKLGGGLHLRAGTRRWGFTAGVLAPQLMAELAFDLRFGLFEKRSKGGWRPAGVVYSTDRRVPRWR